MNREEEHRHLNDKLVMPAFRQFCRENDLPFHFWDELPPGSFNPKIGHKEMDLLDKAMKLFNRLKPDVVLFEGRVIRFQLTSTDGEFECSAWAPEDALKEMANSVHREKLLEGRCQLLGAALAIVIAAIIASLLFRASSGFFSSALWHSLISLGFAIPVGMLLYREFSSVRTQILSGADRKRCDDQLAQLRKKLLEGASD